MSTRQFNYDLIVIGAGGGGLTAALTAKGLGKTVAVAERKKIGGECTHSGCVPSKALIKAAAVQHARNEGPLYGLSEIQSALGKPFGYVSEIVEKIYEHEKPEVLREQGIDVLEGEASFVDNHTVSVGGRNYKARKFIITTGSSPFVPPVEGMDTVEYLTNETVFQQETVPESLIIMGGGPIGIEMAQAFSRLGSKVTVVEMSETILPREEADLSNRLAGILTEEGVTILTSHKVVKVEKNGDGVNVCVVDETTGNARTITASRLLAAVGRYPNKDMLNGEKAGVNIGRGGVIINNRMETSAKNIYAAGDVAGPYQFSHMAEYQAIIAVLNAFLPVPFKADYSLVPWVTFTSPELARFGLTEEDARATIGNSIRVYTREYSTLDRANTDNNANGIVKIILSEKGYIIGAHILGYAAGELLHQLTLINRFNRKLSSVQGFIYAYPTYSDIIKRIAREAYKDELNNNFFIKLLKMFSKK